MLSQIWLCATLWTVDCQAPLSMGFSRLEYWSGLPFPPPGNLTNPGIEPVSLAFPALAGRFLYHWATWALYYLNHLNSFSQHPSHDSQFYRWENQGAGRLISSPDRARAFIDGGRGLHAETAQSALMVILKWSCGGLISIILIFLSTVNLQFQGHFFRIFLRPILGIVAVYVMATVWSSCS